MVQCLNHLFNRFKRDERGSFSVFIVMTFTTMILVAGAAIDFIRFEAVRSSIQYNLDRAVIAAASMRQTRDPADVVADYMSKVETLATFNVTMDDDNTSVTLTGRRVSAVATATIDTYFLRLTGINTMDVTASSRASEEIPNLEISMVLDVSGSMSGSKIASLQTAANTFVDTVIIDDDESLTSISIVPYSTNVTVPQSMWDFYATEGLTNNTRCMVFDDADYSSPGINMAVTQRQLPYYSYNGGFQTGHNFGDCKTAAYAEIMPFSTSISDLQAKINSLVATGSTASHIGAKWGVALLDPSANALGADIGGEVAAIPTGYSEAGVLKVLILMTDGKNTSHYDLKDDFRSGASRMYYVTDVSEEEVTTYEAVCSQSWMVWYFINRGYYRSYCHYEAITITETVDNSGYYIYKPENSKYYKVNNGYSQGAYSSSLPGNPAAVAGENGYQINYSWPEVWEMMSTYGYGKTIGESWSYAETRYSSSSEADAQMLDACSAAKSNGIVVYTIAFSAPSSAETLLKNCATSLSNYYDVDTTDIATAFASIAVSVQKLKLTQ